ncbi:uncharacterized protein LOC126406100 isoform X1 [Epinephelus moara]|uniref:uncharacterized protein LOC126406100 isoform X1 n=1 Tax=Epinephelus moara TaxID=300413 RepID=UPI00214F423F|nr:uncharacterized protein LOC126406100 isoform X1 [Epinephelus moara]
MMSHVNMLKERFGRRDLVVSAHMAKLLNLTPVKKSSDIVALRQLYDECEVQIRGLESLGVVSDTYRGLLCPILLQMIPDDLALAYTRKTDSGHELEVQELISFLQLEVESRERAMHLTKVGTLNKDLQPAHQHHYKPDSGSGKSRKPSLPSAATLHTSSSNSPRGCLFCDSTSHTSELCTDDTVSTQKEKLKKMGRCFVCLGQQQVAKFCRTKNVSCSSKCGRRRHPTMCDKDEQTEPPNSAQETTDTVISSVAPHTVKTSTGKSNTVLLQTVTAWAEGPRGKRKVRCLMDGGSQRSFVLQKQVKTLGLPVVKRETLKLHTFGSEIPATMEHSIVKLVLLNIDNKELNTEIEAVETLQVSSAIMQVPREQIRLQLEKKGLPSADVSGRSDEELELSVLIGADYYWKMVSGRVERLSESLVAIETIFGWTVQGPVSMSSMKIGIEQATQVSNQQRTFWEIESLGISSKGEEQADDVEAQQNFDRSVRYTQGRYEVKLPW